jgi:hypothetical protein
MAIVSKLHTSGTKTYAHLFGTLAELAAFARRLKVTFKPGGGKGRDPHLDLTPHQREIAIRYGAKEEQT